MVIKDVSLFTFKCDKGNVTIADDNLYTYPTEITTRENTVTGVKTILFIITEDTDISVKLKPGFSIKVKSENSRYY